MFTRHCTLLAATCCMAAGVHADTIRVTLDEGLANGPVSGRLIVFFITAEGERWERTDPAQGPFFSVPQPIASIQIDRLEPGVPMDIDTADMATFPLDFAAVEGSARVRAVLDRDATSPSVLDAPNNFRSDIVTIDLVGGQDDVIALQLAAVTEPTPLSGDTNTIKWVEFRSEMLSEFYGRDVHHRAGIALTKDAAEAYGKPTREVFPAIYVVPGFGGDHRGASRYARMLEANPDTPRAVYIVLDPASPYGHHGFMNSPNHGPRARALVEEFIPELERRFHLAPSADARIITGHSSGGWSSLWLGLHHPDTFGACWSSAPDPVDFRAFQLTNIYEDDSMYLHDGAETPSYRRFADGVERIAMTVREEALMERAVSPNGDSGQQWDTWEAMFGPRDPQTGLPAPMFDSLTGAIDDEVVEHWKAYDIGRLVASDWVRYGPPLVHNIRLVCGSNDSFYLNLAVSLLKDAVDPRRSEVEGFESAPGYIRLIEGADHGSVIRMTRDEWNREMREYLAAQGFPQE